MKKTVMCELCPNECILENGQHSRCRARMNKDGTLFSLVYGKPCAVHVDPIEKKPFFHFPAARASHIARDLNCFLMMMKSTKKSSAPITPDVRPMMYQAFHSGMKVLRYFSDPMSKKMKADPINRITRADKALTITPMINSLWRRFLIVFSVLRIYSLRMAFISLNNSSMISLTVGN
jgi:hypothetical protein